MSQDQPRAVGIACPHEVASPHRTLESRAPQPDIFVSTLPRHCHWRPNYSAPCLWAGLFKKPCLMMAPAGPAARCLRTLMIRGDLVGLYLLQQMAHPLNLARESCSQICLCQLPFCGGVCSGQKQLAAHTAVTFLTLLAVIPRSPPCLASIVASFMSLRKCQSKSFNHANAKQANSLRLHEEHIIQKHLGWFEVRQMETAARPGGWGYRYHDISVFAHVAVRMSLDNLLDRRARVQLLTGHV